MECKTFWPRVQVGDMKDLNQNGIVGMEVRVQN